MKKKFLALFAALTLSITPVYADLPDISNLSLEELQELKEQIELKIVEDGGVFRLAQGLYTVGTDIKAGSYLLTATDDERYFQAFVGVFEGEDVYNQYLENCENGKSFTQGSYGIARFSGAVSKTQNMTVTLKDGDILFVDLYDVFISESKTPFAP